MQQVADQFQLGRGALFGADQVLFLSFGGDVSIQDQPQVTLDSGGRGAQFVRHGAGEGGLDAVQPLQFHSALFQRLPFQFRFTSLQRLFFRFHLRQAARFQGESPPL